MKLVSWNCRGLGGNQKTEVLKRIKTMESNPILLIQETKKTVEDSLSSIKKILPKGKGKVVSVTGASGGILTWWDKDKFTMCTTIENKNWLFIELEDKENKETL